MEAFVIETPAGLFIVNKEFGILEKVLFSNDPKIAAAEMKQLQDGRIADSISASLKQVSGKADLIFENEVMAKAAESKIGIRGAIRENAGDQFRTRLASQWEGREKWVEEQGLGSSVLRNPQTYNDFVRRVTLQLARAGIALATARRDLSAVQAVRAVDDLDKTLNLLAGRVREWYGLHFPEMDRIIEKHDTYARLVSKLGNRRNFTHDILVSEGLPQDVANQLADAAARSMGAQLEDLDLSVLQSFCQQMLDLYKFREKSEAYVGEVLKTVAPNMSAIVGASLSARLISIAGSLQNLAKMPASTLQVLGAEKALFRSLKTGARPPKHGVIFQHTAIHQSPRWQRGKIARALSGKLSIAARVDAFNGEFVGEKLRDDVAKKVEEIKSRYKNAPPMKKREFGRKR